jgi:hypothetical protein
MDVLPRLALLLGAFIVAWPQRATAAQDANGQQALASSRAVIHNHTEWHDTKGNLIDCHEGGILRVGPRYYWYGRGYHGNDTGVFGTEGARFRCGFNCYSSSNLVDWAFEGKILSYPDSGWLTEGTWHRPRVLFNETTKKYVLWFFCLGIPGGKAWVKDVVAVAEKPAGPFTIVGQPAISIDPSGDLAMLQDVDGKGYLANGDWKRNCLILRLADDFLSTVGEPVVALPAAGRNTYEGVCLARFKGKYIACGSGVVGLKASDTTYAVADHPMGPYVVKGLMSEQRTWGSQISSFCYIQETDGLFALCDQWLTSPDGQPTARAEQSAQLWLPVIFDASKERAQMRYVEQWDPRAEQE